MSEAFTSVKGRVLKICVASGSANVLDATALEEATRRIRSLASPRQASSQGVGAVQIVHPGRNFCAGGDVRSFPGSRPGRRPAAH
ncbi:hypothetical protein [Pseudofrankia asymbiotica]|uniref:hypothetical protein n=1 Tax=Pseudofrankia asymbiotica TaxID=1834516 RepID=UPI001056C5FE|nr:hypothetical protein [Pseudofrankia asymbiotica]